MIGRRRVADAWSETSSSAPSQSCPAVEAAKRLVKGQPAESKQSALLLLLSLSLLWAVMQDGHELNTRGSGRQRLFRGGSGREGFCNCRPASLRHSFAGARRTGASTLEHGPRLIGNAAKLAHVFLDCTNARLNVTSFGNSTEAFSFSICDMASGCPKAFVHWSASSLIHS
ncbi:hypothetical protein MRX96_042940 [Rhipicephalus microplus]